MENEVEKAGSKVIKAWYKSKTIWFNLALGMVGVLEASTGTLKPLLGDHYGVVMLGVAMAGMMLRTVSTTEIGKK